MSNSNIHLSSQVKRSTSLAASEIGDDLVILSVNRGRYYGTQIVGKRIWALLDNLIDVSDICDILTQEFEVDRPTCEREVIAFLEQLSQEDLIEVK